jgi:hypothetical protein
MNWRYTGLTLLLALGLATGAFGQGYSGSPWYEPYGPVMRTDTRTAVYYGAAPAAAPYGSTVYPTSGTAYVPSTAYYPAPAYAAPVVAYRPVVAPYAAPYAAYRPVVVPAVPYANYANPYAVYRPAVTYAQPYVVNAPAPAAAFSPPVYPAPAPAPAVAVGPKVWVHPKVYVEGEPIRNLLKAITP